MFNVHFLRRMGQFENANRTYSNGIIVSSERIYKYKYKDRVNLNAFLVQVMFVYRCTIPFRLSLLYTFSLVLQYNNRPSTDSLDLLTFKLQSVPHSFLSGWPGTSYTQYLSLSLYLSFSHRLSLSFYIALCHYVSLCLSVYLYIYISQLIPFYISLFIYKYFSIYLSIFLSLSS